MTATSPTVWDQRLSPASRIARALSTWPPALAALMASRALVLLAGVAGALTQPRVPDWDAFDPARLSDRLGSLGNVLGAVSVRWDSIHYLSIAEHGYTRSTAVFFPLYPLLIRMLAYATGSAPLAGAVISAVSFAVALTLMHRLTRLEMGERAAGAAVLLVAFAPLSFFFTAVYTEGLFLALSVGSVYAARRERWVLAAILGGLAAVTRVTGVVLLIPLGIMRLRRSGGVERGLATLVLVPTALAGYLAFTAAKGYGVLAPFVQQTGAQHQHRLTGPLDTIALAVHAALRGVLSLGSQPTYQPSVGGPLSAGTESVLLLAVLALAVVMLVATFRRLPLEYGAFAAASLLICISSPVAGQPLRSLDRYTLTIFPLWMAAGAWVSERRLTVRTVIVGASLLAFFSFQFATWAFIA